MLTRTDRHRQVFDQIYLTGGGAPGKTLLTPAYLAYQTSFKDLQWGQGAAIAFILFAIIVALTLLQRFILRDRDPKVRTPKPAKAARVTAAVSEGDVR